MAKEHHLATVWEHVADAVPGRPALIDPRHTRTWAQYDDRAARLAAALSGMGVGTGGRIAIYAYNRNEWLETTFAAFKLRAVPLNVNYRYLEDELVYLLADGEAEAVVFEGCFAPRIAAVRDRLPRLRHAIQVDDGSPLLDGARAYEDLIAGQSPLPRQARSADDRFVIYTGGTTGMPRGAVYRHGDVLAKTVRGYLFRGLPVPETVEDLLAGVRQLDAADRCPRVMPACPLMHGMGIYTGAMFPMNMGGCTVMADNRRFDPHVLWQTVVRHRVEEITIVGDSFARPLLEALDEAAAAGRPYDLSAFRQMLSAGVIWSQEVKAGLLRHADLKLVDSLGCTEGAMAINVATRGNVGETARFTPNAGTRVLTEDGRDVRPGSGEIGHVAMCVGIPLEYDKDPEKTARTFRVFDGVRYCLPGDQATIEADGTLVLLGRGALCINTGGEKVFPEEVEEVLKRHPGVADCAVVGLPDPLFGEQVAAVVARRPGTDVTAEDLIADTHGRIAGYKVPRRVVFVDAMRRGDNGKMDYPWARAAAEAP
ncbi:MAG: AMP-binding protein [Hyphomicrobiales bacterium]|nr:AMP-binding protein [Hyphomicrobiales bacterium]MCP5374105.1 AMP-binding protein [Hyphomicrobiales bacterium]